MIFVKGTTDALNRIAAEQARLDGRQVLVTEMEHHADLLPWRHRSGHVMVGLTPDGHIDLEAIEHALKEGGGPDRPRRGERRIQRHRLRLPHPRGRRAGSSVRRAASRSTPRSSRRITASTSVPRTIPATSISSRFSGHKMYAPYGAGVLVAPRDFFSGAPEVMGGGAISIVTWDDTVWADLPDREEAGSPNVIGAVALGVAIETLLELGFDEMLEHEIALGRRLLEGLSDIPGVTCSAAPEPAGEPERLALASFVIDGVHHGLVAAALSHEWGIAVRNGCFCANPYVFHLLQHEQGRGRRGRGRGHGGPPQGACRARCARASRPTTPRPRSTGFVEAVRQIARGQIEGDVTSRRAMERSPPRAAGRAYRTR